MRFALQVGKFYNDDETPECDESSLSSPADGGGAVLAAVVVVFPPAKSYLMLKKKKQPVVVVLLILFLNSLMCLNMISLYSIPLVLTILTRSIHFCRNW